MAESTAEQVPLDSKMEAPDHLSIQTASPQTSLTAGNPHEVQASPSNAARTAVVASSLVLSASLDEDEDANAALYTEVVLSDEDDNNIYGDDDDDDDFTAEDNDRRDSDQFLNDRQPTKTVTPNRNRLNSTGSPLRKPHSASPHHMASPASNRHKRGISLDGYADVYGDEEDFRIRHLLNYGEVGGSTSSVSAPPVAAAHPPAENEEVPFSPPVSPRLRNSAKKNADAALLVDDKPWRNSGYKGKEATRGRPGSLLGYFRKKNNNTPKGNKMNTAEDGNDIIAALEDALANDQEIEDDQSLGGSVKPTTNAGPASPLSPNSQKDPHDLVVEAASRASPDDSSFGDQSSQEDWDLDYFDDRRGEENKDCFTWERPVDWRALGEYRLPSNFILTTSNHADRPASGTFDHQSNGNAFSQRDASNFVWQHGMILHAVLQLLVERDHLGVEDSMDEAHNVWKKGPLKKLAQSGRKKKGPNIWKVKFVEIRKGNLCYYEDSGQETGRKSIHLRASDTTVEACSGNGKSDAFCFEIAQTGSKTRLWMAKSELDRQAWIRAIQAAMIGGDDDFYGQGALAKDVASHRAAIDRFSALRATLGAMDVHQDYVSEAQAAASKGVIQLPVSWVRQQVNDLGSGGPSDGFKPRLATNGDPQKQIRASITEFWEKMNGISFALNGIAIQKSLPVASERMFGSLTRSILEFDHAFGHERQGDSDQNTVISEFQACSYARDILVTVLRTREQEDVLYAVNDLFRNDDLVVVSALEEHEMVHLEVSFAGDDLDEYDKEEKGNEMMIWVHTKKKNSATSRWSRRYAVLSGAVLSYYEAANPRPHGLRGQLDLDRGSSVQKVEVRASNTGDTASSYVLLVSTESEERYLLFEDEHDMIVWKGAIQSTIDSCREETTSSIKAKKAGKTSSKDQEPTKTQRPEKALRIPGSIAKGGKPGMLNGGMRVILDAQKVFRKRGSSSASSGQAPIPRRPSVSLLIDQNEADKREPSVQCVAQHLHKFVVYDRFDTNSVDSALFTVHAKLFQAFTILGGSSGRLSRGKPLVEIEIKDNATSGLLEEDEAFEKLMLLI